MPAGATKRRRGRPKKLRLSGKFKIAKEKLFAKLKKLHMRDVKVNLISSKEFAEIFNKLF